MPNDSAWVKSVQAELREILNGWDPIGVYAAAEPGDEEWLPEDEYDCIREPLITRLNRGDDRAQVATFLRQELRDHFGLPNALVAQEFVDQVFAWWETVR